MKKTIFIAIIGFLFSACNTPNSMPAATKSTTDTIQSTVAIYQCPMDKDVTSDKPGKCPKCGMDLELKK